MRTAIFCLALLAFSLALVRRAHAVFSDPFPLSIDGCFYLQELRTWQEGVPGYYGTAPVFFMAVSLALGLMSSEPLVQYGLLVLAAQALQCAAIATLALAGGLRECRPSVFALLILAVWLSPSLFYLAYHFPRFSVAASLLLIAFGGAVPAIKELRVPSIWTLLAAAAGALCHKGVAVLAGVLIMMLVYARGCSRNTACWRDSAVPVSHWQLLTLTILSAAGIFVFVTDFEVIRTSLRFPNIPYFLSHSATMTFGLGLQIELACMLSLALGLLVSYRISLSGCEKTLAALLLISIGPWWSAAGNALGLRLALFSSVLALGLTALLSARLPASSCQAVLCFVSLTAALGGAVNSPTPARVQGIAVIARHAKVLQEVLPHGSFVKAPHGLEFAVTYFVGRRSAQLWPQSQSFRSYFEILWAGSEAAGCKFLGVNEARSTHPNQCFDLGQGWMLRSRQSGRAR